MADENVVQENSRMERFWSPILAGLGTGAFLGIGLGFLAVALFATPALVLPIFFATLLTTAALGALGGLVGGLIMLFQSDPVSSATKGPSATDKPTTDHNPLAGLGNSVAPAARNETAPEHFSGPFSTPADKTPPAEPGSTPSPPRH